MRGHSLILFDIHGRPRRKLSSAPASRKQSGGHNYVATGRPVGQPQTKLRVALMNYLKQRRRGHRTAELADRFQEPERRVQEPLGRMTMAGLVRNERVKGTRGRLWFSVREGSA